MPQLDPTWFVSQIFWLLVTFGLLYLVLSKAVLPSLLGIAARREATISDDIVAAELLKTEAETARQDYEKALAESREKAQALIDEALAGQKVRSEQANKELDEKIAVRLNEASERITKEKNELLDALAPATEELTSLIVEKLIKRNPAKEKVGNVITQLFKANNS